MYTDERKLSRQRKSYKPKLSGLVQDIAKFQHCKFYPYLSVNITNIYLYIECLIISTDFL
jgi:hypothetical protein